MAISGYSSTRMLARYTHPTERRKVAALESIDASLVTKWSQPHDDDELQHDEAIEAASFAKESWWTAGGSNP